MMDKKLLELAELAGFILTDDKTGIDWSSDYDDCLIKFARLIKAGDKKINTPFENILE